MMLLLKCFWETGFPMSQLRSVSRVRPRCDGKSWEKMTHHASHAARRTHGRICFGFSSILVILELTRVKLQDKGTCIGRGSLDRVSLEIQFSWNNLFPQQFLLKMKGYNYSDWWGQLACNELAGDFTIQASKWLVKCPSAFPVLFHPHMCVEAVCVLLMKVLQSSVTSVSEPGFEYPLIAALV